MKTGSKMLFFVGLLQTRGQGDGREVAGKRAGSRMGPNPFSVPIGTTESGAEW